MPRLRQIGEQKVAEEVRIKAVDFQQCSSPWEESGLTVEHPFSWRLLKWFGAFPAAMDRHVTEFFPQLFGRKNGYYGRTLGVDAFPFETVIELGDRTYAEIEEYALSPDPLPADYFESITGEHEQVVEIIESIRQDLGRVYSANLPNGGQIPNLPSDVIVECPAVADSGGLRPIMLPAYDSALASVLATRLQWVETVVDAALQGSRKKFVQAMLLDGSVTSLDDAVRLAGELLQAQREHLPQFHGSPGASEE